MPLIVLSVMPLERALAKASSRSGPTAPLVPARARAWQLPQVPLPMKRVLPFTRSGSALWPQPAAPAARTAAARGTAMLVHEGGRGKAAGILTIAAGGARLSRAGEVVEPAFGRGDHAIRHALPSEPGAGELRQRRGSARAAVRVQGEPGREFLGDLVDGVRPQIEG